MNLYRSRFFRLRVKYINVKSVFKSLIALAVFFLLTSCGEERAEEGDRPTTERTTSVKGVVVDTFEVANDVLTPGTFSAYEQLNITPEIPGLIKKINFNEGSRVQKGQLLISMDDRELIGEIKKLELEISLATDERMRIEKLFEIRAVSEEELQRAKNREATLKAEKELLEVRQSKLNVYAPFPGEIGLRHVSEGNFINPGTRIATLHQIHPLKLDFEVPETYVHQIGVGSEVTFSTVESSESRKAVIYAIEPGINPQTRTMLVRARVDNQNGRLLPGRFAHVILKVDINPNAVMVPTEAIIPVIDGQKIFISDGGRAKGVSVNTGIRTENFVEIKEGLNPGDTVITTGLMSLAEGERLKIDLVDFSELNNL